MAEAAGLAVGVVALAGLFNNTVECFEYVQLGRTFGKDYQTSQLQLDCTRLRLSRWGKSLGLDQAIQDTASLHGRFLALDVKHAEDLLGQILCLFKDAEHISEKYSNRTETRDAGSAVFNPQTDLAPTAAKLHEQMRRLAVERQNRSSVRQKFKWALFEKERFQKLIEDITDLVDKLIQLFPATEQIQLELCERELSSIGGDEHLLLLKEIVTNQDKLLDQAIMKANDGASRSQHVTFSGSGNSGLQQAYNYGSMSIVFGKS